MKTHKLTTGFVKRVAFDVPPEADTTYADQDLSRHYLRVRPPAQPGIPWLALYGIRYVLPDGSKRKLKTGDPRTMDLDAARAAARLKLAMVDAGQDPAAERAGQRAAWTVRQLWEAYQASREFALHAAKTQAATRSAFENHVVPRLGGEKLAAIDVPAVKRLIAAITTDKRLNARHRAMGGSGCARKVTRILSSALTWAVGQGELPRNPIIGNLRLDGDGEREIVITEPQQYVDLLAAMDRLVAAGELRPQARAFILAAALTGMRRGELQSLTAGQVDLAARRITLTSSKGAKLARHGVKTETISLPAIAASALSEVIPADAAPEDRVFVPHQGKVIEVNRDWTRVRQAAGLPDGLALHSLRHSIGTVAVLQGLSAPEVQKLLRHRNISTTAKYIHLAEATTARLQDRATAHLLPDPRPSADTVTLPRRGA